MSSRAVHANRATAGNLRPVQKSWLYYLAKGLEGIGLLVVLVGVILSIQLGVGEEEGFESMKAESYGLGIGGALFAIGWLLERSIGSR